MVNFCLDKLFNFDCFFWLAIVVRIFITQQFSIYIVSFPIICLNIFDFFTIFQGFHVLTGSVVPIPITVAQKAVKV